MTSAYDELRAIGYEPPTITTWDLDAICVKILQEANPEQQPEFRKAYLKMMNAVCELLDERDGPEH